MSGCQNDCLDEPVAMVPKNVDTVSKEFSSSKSYVINITDVAIFDKAPHVVEIVDWRNIGDKTALHKVSEKLLLKLRGVGKEYTVATPTRQKEGFM